MVERLSDETTVVRGRRNRAENLRRGTATHPCGLTGISVEAADDLSVDELALGLPRGQIGFTTVGAVRANGGDVVSTSGYSPHHATLTGLTPETASLLLTPTISNRAKSH